MDRDLSHKLRDEAMEFLFNGKGDKNVKVMALMLRTVGSMVITFIQCRNRRDMTSSDHMLIYKIVKRYKIDFGACFMHNLQLTLQNPRSHLSYVLMLTCIFWVLQLRTMGEKSAKIT